MSQEASARNQGGPIQVGRYLMYGVIASGGMASVHYGILNGPVGFRRTVAIKRLHEQFAEDPEFVAQFLDEARLVARIRHPNVAQTLDVVAEKRRLLLVMEYVEGETLARLLAAASKGGGAIPIEIASGLVAGALHGLHAAHEAIDEHGVPLSIVHRDVSPQNILVGKDGVSRVLDFGVAKAAARIHSTQGAKLKGKLRYMAPEQVSGEAIDRRADVFAAGIVLWQALTGKRLFDSDAGPGAIIHQVLSAPIPPPSSHRPEIPAALDRVALRALERSLEGRYQTAHEMAIGIEEAVRVPSAHQIGTWVREVARAELDARARAIADMERGSAESSDAYSSAQGIRASLGSLTEDEELTRSSDQPRRPDETHESHSQQTEFSSVTGASTREPRSRRRFLVAGGIAALVVSLGFVIWPKRSPDTVRTSASVGTPSPAPSASPPSPEPTGESPGGSPAPTPSPAVPSTELPPDLKSSEQKPATGSKTNANGARGSKPGARNPKPGCASPTYVDAAGIRRIKVECL